MPRFLCVPLLGIALLIFTASAYAQTSRPVDTLQFGLLDLGMSMATVRARLGPPAHIETETRTVLVPLRDRTGRHGDKHDAPPYVVRTTEIEWWYYPEGSGSMATVLEFRNGELYTKDKYR